MTPTYTEVYFSRDAGLAREYLANNFQRRHRNLAAYKAYNAIVGKVAYLTGLTREEILEDAGADWEMAADEEAAR